MARTGSMRSSDLARIACRSASTVPSASGGLRTISPSIRMTTRAWLPTVPCSPARPRSSDAHVTWERSLSSHGSVSHMSEFDTRPRQMSSSSSIARVPDSSSSPSASFAAMIAPTELPTRIAGRTFRSS